MLCKNNITVQIIFKSNDRIYGYNLANNETACVTLLGINIDQQLRWSSHIDTLIKRLNRALFAVNRISKTCVRETTVTT